MRITKDQIRLCKKEGWYDGHSRFECKPPHDWDDMQMINLYEIGYYEGLEAPDEATTPYGMKRKT